MQVPQIREKGGIAFRTDASDLTTESVDPLCECEFRFVLPENPEHLDSDLIAFRHPFGRRGLS